MNFSRFFPYGSLVLSAAFVCLTSSFAQEAPASDEAAAEQASKPNILFILVDDMRYGEIAHLGAKHAITPNIDKIAQRGLAFNQCFIQGGTAQAICKPSRAQLLTGKYMFALDRSGTSIPDDHTMLGEHLQKFGYDAFFTGKYHNGKETINRSFNKGEAIFFGGMDDHWTMPVHRYDPEGKYPNTRQVVKRPFVGKEEEILKGEYAMSGIHASEVFTDATIEFIENRDPEKPFLAFVSYTAPHDPRSAPQEYLDMYDVDKIELPPNFMKEFQFDYGGTQIRGEKLVYYPRQEQEIREHLRDYYAIITHMDAEIGRLLETLEEQGLNEDTLIVFTSDNGIGIGSHAMMAKQNQYDHALRVPLIFAGEGIVENQVHQARVQLPDVFPTLCEMLGLPIPESVETQSFAEAFSNPDYAGREVLYSGYFNFQRAVLKGDYKYIRTIVNGVTTEELFQRSTDPWEINNLAEEKPEIRAEYEKLLFETKEAYGDDMIDFGQESAE